MRSPCGAQERKGWLTPGGAQGVWLLLEEPENLMSPARLAVHWEKFPNVCGDFPWMQCGTGSNQSRWSAPGSCECLAPSGTGESAGRSHGRMNRCGLGIGQVTSYSTSRGYWFSGSSIPPTACRSPVAASTRHGGFWHGAGSPEPQRRGMSLQHLIDSMLLRKSYRKGERLVVEDRRAARLEVPDALRELYRVGFSSGCPFPARDPWNERAGICRTRTS